MKVSFETLLHEFTRILTKNGFSEEKAAFCARIFAENSRDGIYTHGLNRFPTFVKLAQDGLVDPQAEPEKTGAFGVIEQWDGHLAPGMYTAAKATERAIALAKESGMGCVAVRNGNHWMRGGTYGWMAAEAGCIAICCSNTIANVPPWGGTEPRLGNNPLVIAVPRAEGPVVLDMAISQFSFGKLSQYSMKGEELPVAGGYDDSGNLSTDPEAIRKSGRALPIGFWKGSGLSLILDMLIVALSGGNSTEKITASGVESGVSQFFICIHPKNLNASQLEEILAYTKTSATEDGASVQYPGERTLATRKRNEAEGIPVEEEYWNWVLAN